MGEKTFTSSDLGIVTLSSFLSIGYFFEMIVILVSIGWRREEHDTYYWFKWINLTSAFFFTISNCLFLAICFDTNINPIVPLSIELISMILQILALICHHKGDENITINFYNKNK